jgi:hypothetical protein
MGILQAKLWSAVAVAFSLLIIPPIASIAQVNDTDPLIIIVNLERIMVQLSLAESSLDSGDYQSAFAHAFIPHATTFPSIKNIISSTDSEQATTLESMLSDIPIKIRSETPDIEGLKKDFAAAREVISGIAVKVSPQLQSDKPMTSQIVVFLLRDSVQSYQLFQSEKHKVNYENAVGLAQHSESRFQGISKMFGEARRLEVNSFFSELKSSIQSQADSGSVARLAGAIERDLAVFFHDKRIACKGHF